MERGADQPDPEGSARLPTGAQLLTRDWAAYAAGAGDRAGWPLYFPGLRQPRRLWREAASRCFPITSWLPKYPWRNFILGDMLTGILIGHMQVVQGLALARIASWQPSVGLYASIFPGLLYFIFGSCGTNIFGVTESLACMARDVVVFGSTQEQNDYLISESDRTNAAVYVSLIAGTVQLLLFFFDTGVIGSLINQPMAHGIMSGTAVIVISIHLNPAMGNTLRPHYGPLAFFYYSADFVQNIAVEFKWVAMVMSSSMLVLVSLANIKWNDSLLQRYSIYVPVEFIGLVLGRGISEVLGLRERYNLAVLGGVVPHGPTPGFTHTSPRMLIGLLPWSIIFALVAYSLSMCFNRIVGEKQGFTVDYRQELLAHGLSNLFCSVWKLFPAVTSVYSTITIQRLGSMSHIPAFTSSITVILMIFFSSETMSTVPLAMLSGLSIANNLSILVGQLPEVRRTFRISPIDFLVWLGTFTGTIVLGTGWGASIAIFAQLMIHFLAVGNPPVYLIGRIPVASTEAQGRQKFVYMRMTSQICSEVPGVKILQVHGPINFCTQANLRHSIIEHVGFYPTNIRRQYEIRGKTLDPTKAFPDDLAPLVTIPFSTVTGTKTVTESMRLTHVVIDTTSSKHMDSSGVSMLEKIQRCFRIVGIKVIIVSRKKYFAYNSLYDAMSAIESE